MTRGAPKVAACSRVDGRLVVLAGAIVVLAGARARAGAKVNTSSARRLGRGMVREFAVPFEAYAVRNMHCFEAAERP